MMAHAMLCAHTCSWHLRLAAQQRNAERCVNVRAAYSNLFCISKVELKPCKLACNMLYVGRVRGDVAAEQD